ncbi:hypothetical protein XENOCAPTIV_022525 [Xenoophorus captivus]|uniref:Homeobox domain-containing protein n=1 Tax=Xenoophorus captivus TaxID=1517983 RepID=A0ABV0QNG9_9TELE
MDGSRMSDFSIERILSPQLGRKQLEPVPDGYLWGVQGGFNLKSASSWAPAPVPVMFPVPVPVHCCLQYRGMCFGDGFCPCSPAFHHHHAEISFCSHWSPNTAGGSGPPHVSSESVLSENRLLKTKYLLFFFVLIPDVSDATQSGYQQPGGPLQCRQKARMRTVFTDSQTKQLEALFELTDYPDLEARTELARTSGLSEETVRVWFKNRRARRKRQRSRSKVRSPCPSPSDIAASSERKTYSSFL